MILFHAEFSINKISLLLITDIYALLKLLMNSTVIARIIRTLAETTSG